MASSDSSPYKPETRQAIVRRFAHLLKTLPRYRHIHDGGCFYDVERHGYIRLAEEIMRNAFGFWGQHPIYEQLKTLGDSENAKEAEGRDKAECLFIDDEGIMHFSPKIKGYKSVLELVHNAESELEFSSETDWQTKRITRRDRSTRRSRTSPYNEKIKEGALNNYITGRVITDPYAAFPRRHDMSWLPSYQSEWSILTNCSQWRLYRLSGGGGHDLVADVDLNDNSWPKASYFGELRDAWWPTGVMKRSASPADTGDFYTPFLYFSVEWLSLSNDEKEKWLGEPYMTWSTEWKSLSDEERQWWLGSDSSLTPRAKDIFAWKDTGITNATEFLEKVTEPGVSVTRNTLPIYLEAISAFPKSKFKHGVRSLAAVIREMLRVSLLYPGSFPIIDEFFPFRKHCGVISFEHVTSAFSQERNGRKYAPVAIVVEDVDELGNQPSDICNALSRAAPDFSETEFPHSLREDEPSVIIRTNGLNWDVIWVNKLDPTASVTIYAIKAGVLLGPNDLETYTEQLHDAIAFTNIGYERLQEIYFYEGDWLTCPEREKKVRDLKLADIFKAFPSEGSSSKLTETIPSQKGAAIERLVTSIIGVDRAARILRHEESRDFSKQTMIERGIAYLEKSAEAGLVSAMDGLASLFSKGEAVPKDPARAFKWLLRACEAGSNFSNGQLGEAYEMGDGTEQNFAEAARWYYAASKKRDRRATIRLGNQYFHGRGVNRNLGVAVELWKEAQTMPASGDDCCLSLKICMREGHLLAEDKDGRSHIVDTGCSFTATLETVDWHIPGTAAYLRSILGGDVAGIIGNDFLLSGSGLVIDLTERDKGTLWIPNPGHVIDLTKQRTLKIPPLPESSGCSTRRLRTNLEIEGVTTHTLIDTGAQYSYIRQHLDPDPYPTLVDDFSVFSGKLALHQIELHKLDVCSNDLAVRIDFANLPPNIADIAFRKAGADAIVGPALFRGACLAWNRDDDELYIGPLI
jgi:hypothetical protein